MFPVFTGKAGPREVGAGPNVALPRLYYLKLVTPRGLSDHLPPNYLKCDSLSPDQLPESQSPLNFPERMWGSLSQVESGDCRRDLDLGMRGPGHGKDQAEL